MPSVTRSTLSRSRAGYQSLEFRIRLQPIRKSGRTLSRSSGLVRRPRRMLASAAFSSAMVQLRLEHEAGHQRLAAPVDAGAVDPLDGGQVLEGESLGPCVRAVLTRDDVRRGALEHREVLDLLGDGRDDLDRGGTGADDGHPLAGEVGVLGPLRGVEDLAVEGVDAVDVRHLRVGQRAGGGDQQVGGELAARRTHPPHERVVVPAGLLHGGLEAEPVEHPGALGDAADVVLDLRLLGEGPGPVRVGREREGVELRGDVAGGAGIGVVAPGAADVRAALGDQEVGLAGLLELDRGGEPAEAGADHERVHVGGELCSPRHAAEHTDGIEQASIVLLNKVQ